MTGPLDGIRVIELALEVQGPFAGLTLSELGMEVIKIEAPGSGDTSRGVALATRYGRGSARSSIDPISLPIRTGPEGPGTSMARRSVR